MTRSEIYINRCIQISEKGLALASPNPSVGAVLVYNDEIIGEGFTSAFGGAHAEVNCINSVSLENQKYISESTLYVSLEPCSHQGKTPACSLLIIENNIKKVVVGSLDPNPLVAGNGIKMLKDKGIQVEFGILESECINANKRFYTFHQKHRPYIILKWAQTKNGYFSPINDEQFWITNLFSKQLVHKWRSEEMSILVGTKTAEIDNPQLNSRLYNQKNPIRLIIDKDLKLKSNLHIFDQKQETIIFNNQKNETLINLKYVKIIYAENIETQILDYLYKSDINSVIIEGGLKTLQCFIMQKLWDEVRILTGENEIKMGSKAPTIKGINTKEFSLGKDVIKHIINTL